MKNNTPNTILSIFCFCVMLTSIACTSESSSEREHYFLDGYDHLEFRDKAGNTVPPSRYIGSVRNNGVHTYRLRDSTLRLVNKRSGELYDGYIRTYHRDTYNLQGEFEDGKMFRLRYWYPNRTLGMDVNYRNGTSSVWSITGKLMVQKNINETYFYYPDSEGIKEIISDTMRSYFNREGEMTGYSIFKDSTVVYYYADGTPRLKMHYKNGDILDGKVQKWYENGRIQATGQYKDGEQVGTWIEYDANGNEIYRQEYPVN